MTITCVSIENGVILAKKFGGAQIVVNEIEGICPSQTVVNTLPFPYPGN